MRSRLSARTNSAQLVARHAVANGLSSSLGDIVFGPPAEAFFSLCAGVTNGAASARKGAVFDWVNADLTSVSGTFVEPFRRVRIFQDRRN
ncbi:hypothetical protein ACIRG5_14015 [Lentzea sp. NPDC102401]|uniref:hypothetical protein n=1 Tax=Lentzea sp. NPDC102401 TaxID=3364128 RepID=UPI0037FB8F7A